MMTGRKTDLTPRGGKAKIVKRANYYGKFNTIPSLSQ